MLILFPLYFFERKLYGKKNFIKTWKENFEKKKIFFLITWTNEIIFIY